MQYYFNFKPKQTFMFFYKERAVVSVFLLANLVTRLYHWEKRMKPINETPCTNLIFHQDLNQVYSFF